MPQTYSDWNNLIFSKIFNEDNGGRAVSLYVDAGLLNEWGEELSEKRLTNDEGQTSFVVECQKYLLGDPSNIAKKISLLAKIWKDGGYKVNKPPEFIGLLALLVLASTWGGDRFHASSFYPRYWDMLGAGGRESMISDIHKVRSAWMALQEWTTQNDGFFGVFKLRNLSPAFKNYGIIIAQGMLRPSDEMELRNIFYEFGADKDSDYPDSTLKAWIDEKKGGLSHRAKSAFESAANIDLFLERVRQELELWDGEPADEGNLGGRIRSLRKSALLCLVDRPEPCFTIRLDLSSQEGDSDVVEYINRENLHINLRALSDGSPLSLPLKQVFINDGISSQRQDEVYRITSAQQLNHFLSSEIVSTRQGADVIYRHAKGDLHIFAKVPSVSVNDYVEVNTLRRNVKHIVMLSMNHPDYNRIEKWAQRFLGSMTEVSRYKPSFISETRWQMIPLRENVREIDGAGLPQLRFERKRIARFFGGLRFYGAGNKYFKNSPPTILFDTIYSVKLTVGEQVIDVSDPSVELNIAPFLKLGQNRLEFSENTPEGILPETAELELSLHEDAEWTPEGAGQWSNQVGSVLNSTEDVMLLGCRTGEVLPLSCAEDISPTWAIYSHDKISKSAMPCSNYFACLNRITRHVGIKFQHDGIVSSLNVQRSWLKTIRETKLHPTVGSCAPLDTAWRNFNTTLDSRINLP